MGFIGRGINTVRTVGNQSVAGTKQFSAKPKFPTATASDNSTYGATTEFVKTAISGLASTSYVNTAVSGLASTSYVDTAVSSKANDSDVVKLSGNQTIAGAKTFENACYGIATTNNNTFVTMTGKSKSSNGYYQYGNGMIAQWGSITAENVALTVTFPKPFSSATSFGLTCNSNHAKAAYFTSITKTNFNLDGSGGIGTSTFYWNAIGY